MDTRDRLRTVTSRQNSLVKDLRQSFSRGELTEDGHCAIESLRTIEEAIRAGLKFKALFLRESLAARAERLLSQLPANVEALLLPDDLFANAVETGSPQGVAALVKVKQWTLEDLLQPRNAQALAPLIVVLVGLQDPGNLGAIVRSADAFDANSILLTEKTVSPYNAKVVRSSAGSLFRLPVAPCKLSEALPALRAYGVRLVASSSHKGTAAPDADLTGAMALFIGNEGAGLPRELLAHMDAAVMVPQSARVESLNAGVAASILLYEAARQRR